MKDPNITLEQLVDELTDEEQLEKALNSPGELPNESQADNKAENRPALKQKLDEFSQFIKEQLNQSAALAVAVNKPRDLTREQLREVKLVLDNHGYSEARLQSAVRNQTNQDIAASIIGYIRRAALGEALIPFEERVAKAMDRILTQHSWTPNQRKWLERLAKQLVHEVIIDREFVNNRFADNGGARQMDKILGEQQDTVLEELNEAMWPERSA